MMKIGILGGTFNPVHLAHIMLAEAAYSQMELDKVLIMPSNNPPHKDADMIASDADRAEMVRIAIKGHDHLEFSDFELKREGVTYTSDTLTMLCEENPDIKYYFIVGADSLINFDKWHEPGTILRKCALVCSGRGSLSIEEVRKQITFLREKYTSQDFVPEIYYIDLPASEISSHFVRKLISYDMPSEAYLSSEVSKYIFAHDLYRNRQFEAIKRDIKALLKPSRYDHVISVAKTAVRLALSVGYETDRPYLAGLLHDCAKYMNDEDMLRTARENGIELNPIEERAVQLVHAKVGAFFAVSKYGIRDDDIIRAVRYHTTGRPDMSMLEKILYIADTIEPLRTWGDDRPLNYIRSIATSDIDLAVYEVLKRTYEHIIKVYKDNVSDETTRTYSFYKELCEGRNNSK